MARRLRRGDRRFDCQRAEKIAREKSRHGGRQQRRRRRQRFRRRHQHRDHRRSQRRYPLAAAHEQGRSRRLYLRSLPRVKKPALKWELPESPKRRSTSSRCSHPATSISSKWRAISSESWARSTARARRFPGPHPNTTKKKWGRVCCVASCLFPLWHRRKIWPPSSCKRRRLKNDTVRRHLRRGNAILLRRRLSWLAVHLSGLSVACGARVLHRAALRLLGAGARARLKI